MKRTIVLLLGVGLAVVAVAGRPLMNERVLMDSARTVPPKFRAEWLHERMSSDQCRVTNTGAAAVDSGSGLRLLSKWGRGPAAEVTGKDTLVVLTLGSEVALLNFAQPDSPQVLSEIQFPSLTAQSYLEDSLLYTSSNADLEVWNVAGPTQPVKRGQLLGAVGDFWIRDTLLFYIRSDTFHVISIASPSNMYQLGSCVESGSATTGSGSTVVVCQGSGFAFVDVSNPASPHEIATSLSSPFHHAGHLDAKLSASLGQAERPRWLRYLPRRPAGLCLGRGSLWGEPDAAVPDNQHR